MAMERGNPNSICLDFPMTDESVMHIYENGDQEWQANGLRHRTDGPAYIKKWVSRMVCRCS